MIRVYKKDSIKSGRFCPPSMKFDAVAIPPEVSFVIIKNNSFGLTGGINTSAARVEL